MAEEGEVRCGEFTVDDLTTAAANGDLAKVRDILRAGVDVNGRNSFGRTAIQVGLISSSVRSCYHKTSVVILQFRL